MIVARWFLLISGPRVRVPGGAPDIERQILRFDVLFVKNLSEEKPPAKLVE